MSRARTVALVIAGAVVVAGAFAGGLEWQRRHAGPRVADQGAFDACAQETRDFLQSVPEDQRRAFLSMPINILTVTWRDMINGCLSRAGYATDVWPGPSDADLIARLRAASRR